MAPSVDDRRVAGWTVGKIKNGALSGGCVKRRVEENLVEQHSI
jgi:hypothetical protein